MFARFCKERERGVGLRNTTAGSVNTGTKKKNTDTFMSFLSHNNLVILKKSLPFCIHIQDLSVYFEEIAFLMCKIPFNVNDEGIILQSNKNGKETSAWVFEVRVGSPYLDWAEMSIEMVIGTLGCSLRRARFHSPLVKTWWASCRGGCLPTVPCVAGARLWRRRRRVLLDWHAAIWEIGSDSKAWLVGGGAWGVWGGRFLRRRTL